MNRRFESLWDQAVQRAGAETAMIYISVERNYSIRNRHRMRYQTATELNLPIGSGAMESAIRRVVNLRLKGASIYLLEKTAEAMLMLRSYYKSGRWNLLKRLSISLV